MYVISIVSVIAFTVSTAWVSQMIEKQSLEDSSSGSAINCAITIYLNFVNLFLNIVRLFGGFGDND
jgi:FtsH-binding integral membrane protein